jgi:type IV secretion system protein VirB10
MSFLDRFKKRPSGNFDPAAQADAEEAAAANTHADAPKEAADRELPSVNAKKKGNKLTGWVAVLFIGGMGLFLIYQMNTGKDRKEKAAASKEAADAKANAISGTLPAITVPDRPPAPQIDDKQPDAPATASASATGQVPAPDGSKPIGVTGNQSGNTGAGGKKELSPWEVMRNRRRLGSLAVKFDDSKGSGSTADGSQQQGQPGGQPQQAGNPQGNGYLQTAGSGNGASGGGANDELGNRLQPTITKATLASKLPDRNYLIPKGAFMDCALETRIDSTVPGMTSCILTRNMYSDNGKLVLLDRGSKIVGQYQGGIKQGQARIFVLWTRVETPAGVVINLDSPGTDALGASGLDGYVDTHFWERFGGAIMLSLIQDGFAAAAQQQQSAGTNQTNITFGNTQQATQSMAAEALKNSINIPPTLMKNHGDHINIFVARDLDFRSVYGIRAQ